MTPAIEVSDLVVRYGEVVAVESASFSAQMAAVTAVLGPNGAGKTSTIETLEGYRAPSAGTVRVLGLDPVRQHHELVPRIGVMLQQGGVYRAIRVSEAVGLFASYYDRPLDADELIERVGLGHRRRAAWRTLSGGEQQRLSLALAMVGRPELVFLDEPSAGLDVAGRRLVHDLVDELRSQGVGVLLATHDQAEAEALADHVVIIDRGRVVAQGSPAELTAAAGPAELRFSSDPHLDTAALAAHLGVAVRSTSSGEYLVDAAGDPQTVAMLTAWLAAQHHVLGDLRAGRHRLEDTFVRLTSETGPADPSAADGGARPRRRRPS